MHRSHQHGGFDQLSGTTYTARWWLEFTIRPTLAKCCRTVFCRVAAVERTVVRIWCTAIETIWLVVKPPLWKIWKSIGMIRNPIYGKITLMATKPPTSNYKASRFKFRMAHKPKKLISTINVLVPSGWDTPSMMAIWNRKPSMMAHLAEGYDSNKMRNTHLWS